MSTARSLGGTVIDAQSVGTTINSDPIAIGKHTTAGFVAKSTSSGATRPTGTMKFQVSHDNSTWYDKEWSDAGAYVTSKAIAAAAFDVAADEIPVSNWNWCRFQWTATSGDDVFSVAIRLGGKQGG